ncbi:MAG: glycosyltransferase family 1 protein [Acidobacteria bacterium]|nr:glycosyltransferase family 1 protein [Acidobacteriota bacterium]
MRILLHSTFRALYQRLAEAWVEQFEKAGHEAAWQDLCVDPSGNVWAPPGAQLHLYLGGLSMLQALAAAPSLPPGRQVLWLFEPLTHPEEPGLHGDKTRLLHTVAPRFHGFLAMDLAVAVHLRRHFPSIPVAEQPYVIAGRHLREPLADGAREIDVLMLGRSSPRRLESEAHFRAAGLDARFVWGGFYGEARYDLWARSRINLNVHRELPAHFDRVRSFEAWAAGCPVVAEDSPDLPASGVVEGLHLVAGPLEELPARCAGLLGDLQARQRLARSGQALLREAYLPEHWRGPLVSFLSSL